MKEFDQFARDYRNIHNDNIKLTGGNSQYFCHMKAKIMAKKWRGLKTPRILDLGCGDGEIDKFLALEFPDSKITGIDISEESLNKAKEKKIPNCVFEEFDGSHIDEPNNYFDLILVAGVFHHVPKNHHHQLISEIHRVLDENGSIFVFEHNPNNWVTRKIVDNCIFDKDAVLLPASYLVKRFLEVNFKKISLSFILFFPRHFLFYPFHLIEPLLSWLPLGGQYFLEIKKRRETK